MVFLKITSPAVRSRDWMVGRPISQLVQQIRKVLWWLKKCRWRDVGVFERQLGEKLSQQQIGNMEE